MTYGAHESNSKEGVGIIVLVTGLTALTAGWAYGTDVVQIVLMLLGVIGVIGGFLALKMARSA